MRVKNEPTLIGKELTMCEQIQLLPECEEVKKYVEKKFKEEDIDRQYYFMPRNKKNVFLILSLTLGGPTTPTRLKELLHAKHESKLVSESLFKEFQQIFINNFSWEYGKQPIDIFNNNMKQLQKVHIIYFLSLELFPKISSTVASQLFEFTCAGYYLYGVKIRWEVCSKGQNKKKYQRKDQKTESSHLSGNSYLIIMEELNQFKVGMLKANISYQTDSTAQLQSDQIRDESRQSQMQNQKKVYEKRQPKSSWVKYCCSCFPFFNSQ